MDEGYDALSEKERETLRLMVRGHDAKSMARELDLSVHTINDRLRAARRKLGVTSSREAARLVFEHEGAAPENLAGKGLGGVGDAETGDVEAGPRAASPKPRHYLVIGVILMSLVLATILLATQATAPEAQPTSSGPPAEAPPSPMSQSDAEVESAARDWLELVDRSDWQASFDAAGKQFRDPNTVETWTEASAQARVPLGDMISRKAISFQQVAAPPNGYQMVRFLSDFENKTGVIETVTLEREAGELKVVGYFIG